MKGPVLDFLFSKLQAHKLQRSKTLFLKIWIGPGITSAVSSILQKQTLTDP